MVYLTSWLLVCTLPFVSLTLQYHGVEVRTVCGVARYSLSTCVIARLTVLPRSHTVSVAVTIRLRDVYNVQSILSETEAGVAVGYNVERPV